MKLDMLTNATVVDDAIRFVSQKSKEGLKSASSSEGGQNEPDYGENEAQLKKEQQERST
jgi:hypothetical protein